MGDGGGESTEKNHKLFVAYFRWVIQKERREHGLSDDLGELVREYEEILPEYAEKLKWLIGFSEEERQEKGDEMLRTMHQDLKTLGDCATCRHDKAVGYDDAPCTCCMRGEKWEWRGENQ